MKSIRITLNLPVLVVMAFLVGVIAFQAVARRPMAASPTVVVTVNRNRVMEGLTARVAAEASLRQSEDKFNAELATRKQELDDLNAQYQDASSGEKLALQTRIDRKSLEAKGYLAYAQMKLDLERSLVMESLYHRICDAIGQMAENEGYDVVLENDSQDEFVYSDDRRISKVDQIRQQIRSRHVMFARPTVDITEALIIRMNNEHNAGSGNEGG